MIDERFPILDFLDDLDEKLLPGEDGQNQMSPVENNLLYRQRSNTYRKAGVLALLFPKLESLHIAFIKRSSQDRRDKHAGQIGFPGGKYEETDNTIMDTALREAHEEIGVDCKDVQILTPLTPLYVYASDFLVSPYLGYINYTPQFKPQITEVESILEIPLSDITQEIKGRKDFFIRNIHMPNVPYYNLEGHTLWGATAMITSEIQLLVESADIGSI